MQSSNQPDKISLPFSNSGQKQPIPVASQIGIEDGRASYTDGFPPLTRTPLAAGGVPPFGTDMNGVLFDVTAIQQWQSAGGGFKYDSAFAASIGGYPKGAILLRSDATGYWQSTAENNTTDPDAGGTGWLPAFQSGSVGQTLNMRMSIASASSSATVTATEVSVATSVGGQAYRIQGFSRTINLATVGAGGMDSGSSPVNGFVAIYAIYNPSSGASALLAVNASSSTPGETYTGPSMPLGYTASSLLTVVPTNLSAQFRPVYAFNRDVWIEPVTTLSTGTQQASLTSHNVSAAIPNIAKTVDAATSISSSISGITLISSIAGGASGIGSKVNATTSAVTGAGLQSVFSDIPVISPQIIFYSCTIGSGTMVFSIAINKYSF